MVMERLYESSIDTIPDSASPVNAYTYRILHTPDFSLVRYSVSHFADFVRGFKDILQLLRTPEMPKLLLGYLDRANDLLNPPVLEQMSKADTQKKLSPTQTGLFGHHVLYRFKSQSQ